MACPDHNVNMLIRRRTASIVGKIPMFTLGELNTCTAAEQQNSSRSSSQLVL
jgi:hypothetical protein